MNRIQRFFFFAALALFATSCVPSKKMIYLQNEEGFEGLYKYERTEYRLQPNDIIDVQVRTLNENANNLFISQTQIQTQQAMQVGAQSGGDLYYMTGYSISDSGTVELPFIGSVNVQGMTLNEARVAIDQEVGKLFKSYYLSVKLGGIRFSTLGEFSRPGKKVLLQNQATIFEAIALSGDLNMVANREEVRLIRQYPEGTKVHTVNLLEDDIISSPYYFIQPNDIIYAEPLPQKSAGIGITGAQTLSTIIGTLGTSLALVLSIISLTN
jgi:polysaccharide export outer membrane protein